MEMYTNLKPLEPENTDVELESAETEEITTLREAGYTPLPNASVLVNFGENEQGQPTYKGEKIGGGEKPTDTVELGDNLYVVSTNVTQGGLICSYGDEVPEGAEIKSIEIYTDEYGWLDIRALATVDNEYNFYVSSVYKAYIEPSENLLCFGGFMAFAPNVFGTMAANGQITNARITYYADGRVSNE